MPHYRAAGHVPAKRHTLDLVDGAPLHEELMGTDGFTGESSLLYHRHSPSAIVEVTSVDRPGRHGCSRVSHDAPVQPRHLRTGMLERGGDAVLGRVVLLRNGELTLAFATADRTGPLYRSVMGDELTYVQSGRAVVETSFGPLEVGPGDYVVMPAGVTHRWVIPDGEVLEALIVESTGHVAIPQRYLTPRGQLAEGAPFTERDLRIPAAPAAADEAEEVPVLVATVGGLTRMVHRHHPFDVVGWDGCLYPYALSIRDFEPVVGSRHLPPPVHLTFEGPGFTVCSFVPRPFDFGNDAVKIPYHHSNVDCDEILFYSSGNFMSRSGSGIGAGSISFHPAGFVHGPQPGSLEASMGADRTEETAVMVDAFRPLMVSDAARRISDPDYAWSWDR